MTRQLAISPDVNIKNVTDWFIFNTKIQRITGESFHATAYSDFADLHAAFAAGRADLVFANAADTAKLVRDHGYLPVAAPREVSNEATIVVSADSELQDPNLISGRLTVAATDSPDVERICRILLEPSDLPPGAIEVSIKPNPVPVAKAILNGDVQAGFLPREAFEELSAVITRQMRVLITSRIYVLRHSMLASPQMADQVDILWQGLEAMNSDPADLGLSKALGAPNGWRRLTQEDVEFMIDLVDALADI